MYDQGAGQTPDIGTLDSIGKNRIARYGLMALIGVFGIRPPPTKLLTNFSKNSCYLPNSFEPTVFGEYGLYSCNNQGILYTISQQKLRTKLPRRAKGNLPAP